MQAVTFGDTPISCENGRDLTLLILTISDVVWRSMFHFLILKMSLEVLTHGDTRMIYLFDIIIFEIYFEFNLSRFITSNCEN